MTDISVSQIPARRRRNLVTRREARCAERRLRRARQRLSDFVIYWAEGVLDQNPYVDFIHRRDALVREYRAAQVELWRLSGQLQ